MKIRIVGVIYILCILILFLFQVMWLYSTYQLEKHRIQYTLNLSLQESVEKEVFLRFETEWDEDDFLSYDTSIDENTVNNPNTKSVALDIHEGLNTGLFQQLMSGYGHPLNIMNLDSIFREELAKNDYSFNYLICYKDSIDNLISHTIDISLMDNKKIVSEPIPIVNNSYVLLYADLSLPAILRQMIGITIASFCLLLILFISLLYIIRYTFTQYRLNKLREDFSQALTHDLKSPLNTIHIALSNYKNGLFDKNPEFGIKSVSVAIDQVLNIQALVDKILTTARLEEKNMEISRSEIDLPVLIQKLIERYSFSANKEVIFVTSYSLKNTPIYADQALLENAISNLIDNAIKYSGEEVKIRINCEVKENKLYIRIIDNGIGISQEDQLKIFNKFERGSAIYRKEAKGFGLGLSYVRQVALAHQGTVALSSVKGKGSEFVIVIPLLLTPYIEDTEHNKIIE